MVASSALFVFVSFDLTYVRYRPLIILFFLKIIASNFRTAAEEDESALQSISNCYCRRCKGRLQLSSVFRNPNNVRIVRDQPTQPPLNTNTILLIFICVFGSLLIFMCVTHGLLHVDKLETRGDRLLNERQTRRASWNDATVRRIWCVFQQHAQANRSLFNNTDSKRTHHYIQ